MAHLLKDHKASEDVRTLLNVAASDTPAGAHGYRAAATRLATIGERLPRALLRCAFAACVRPTHSWDDLSEEENAARDEHRRKRVQAAVDAELSWLAAERSEPDWPTFPSERVRPRRVIRLPGGPGQNETPVRKRSREDEYVNHQAAALWLRSTTDIVDLTKRPWLYDVVREYCHWTARANGAELGKDEEIAHPPDEWNHVYFDLLARSLSGLSSPEVDELALTPITSLPEEPFFDVTTQFLRSVDSVYFDIGSLQEAEGRGWRWLGERRATRGPHGAVQPPQDEPDTGETTIDDDARTLSHPCPCCGGRMIIIETFERGSTPRAPPMPPSEGDSS